MSQSKPLSTVSATPAAAAPPSENPREFLAEGKVFDGLAHGIEPAASRIDPRHDFTISTWLHTDGASGWPVGDILSQYDAAQRRGLGLACVTNTGGSSSQANERHLSFFLTDGGAPRWLDAGRPDGCRIVFGFVVHHGRLLAASNDPRPGGVGRVFEYEAPDRWIDRGAAPDGSNSVHSLVIHDGELYAATGCDDGTGSILDSASNLTRGSHVYRVDRAWNWHDCGHVFEVPSPNQSPTLFTFGGKLFLSSLFHPDLFIYEGGRRWSRVETPRIAPAVFGAYRGSLFVAPKPLKKAMFPDLDPRLKSDQLYRWEGGDRWRGCGPADPIRIYTLAIHDGQLFAGSWPEGRTYRSATGLEWVSAGDCGKGPLPGHAQPRGEIMAMSSYHGDLYVGSLPFGEVYRYDGDDRWAPITRLDHTPDVPLRRVWASVEFDGGLFFSTMPSGRIYRMDTGVGVTAPDPLPAGWHHVAATKSAGELAIYIDGCRVASRGDSLLPRIDATSAAPLKIGAGRYAPLRGKLRGLRLHAARLSQADVATLMENTRDASR